MSKAGKSKASKSTLGWERAEDEEWAACVEVRLVLDHDAPGGLADEVLAEAHEVVRDAGLPAREVLGEADAYARTVAAERIGEERRARVDTHGMLPGERVSATLGTLGLAGVGFCVLGWVEDGLWVEGSWTSIAVCATVVVAVSLGCVAFAVRAAGRIRGMWGFLAGAAAVVAGGAAVAVAASGERLFRVPAPLLALLCAAWAVGAYAFPDATLDRWLTPARRAGGVDDDRYLARLQGLLRGRHAMKTAEARGHVREARQHLASVEEGGGEHGERGVRAEDVFGDVEIYALRLSEGPRREQRVARRKVYGSLATTVVLAVLVVDEVFDTQEPSLAWLVCGGGALAYFAWNTVSEWRALREQEEPQESV
ncbi:hypothetical protein [Streptomyces sp. NPDC048436]|uniref:hypothetical protein n=1 Tax=Streptomyces sp. NPDC048436 TaxID=3365550 RepID=UPI00370F9223